MSRVNVLRKELMRVAENNGFRVTAETSLKLTFQNGAGQKVDVINPDGLNAKTLATSTERLHAIGASTQNDDGGYAKANKASTHTGVALDYNGWPVDLG